jgi:hypothetical protein
MMRRDTTANTQAGTGGRAAASFLVRVWPGAGEEAGQKSLRGHVRHLQTGEELHINDPQRLGELVLRQMLGEQQDGDTPGRISPWDTAFAHARG